MTNMPNAQGDQSRRLRKWGFILLSLVFCVGGMWVLDIRVSLVRSIIGVTLIMLSTTAWQEGN